MSIFAIVEKFDDISMLVESLERNDFTEYSVSSSDWVLLEEILFDDFDCYQLSVAVNCLSKVDFGSISFA